MNLQKQQDAKIQLTAISLYNYDELKALKDRYNEKKIDSKEREYIAQKVMNMLDDIMQTIQDKC